MASRFILPFADVGSGIKPSSGARLFFYETGTSTPKNTFTDQAATTPNANPVIADANGVFSNIFINGTYKVVLQNTNSTQIWEADPVVSLVSVSNEINILDNTSLIAASGLSIGDKLLCDRYAAAGSFVADLLYNIVAGGTGTADGGSFFDLDNGNQAELIIGGELSASHWGVLADGTTDDSLALQACINFAGQRPVGLPYGVTRCGGITTSTSIQGLGSIASFLLDRDGLAPVLTLNGGVKSLFFRDFRINGLGQGTGEAFKLGTGGLISNDMDFTNVYIKGFERGLFSEELDQIWGSVFQGIRIDETNRAFEFLGGATGYTTMTFIDCFAAISQVGWNMQVFEGLTMINCAADAATDTPMNFNYCRGTVINGVYIENSQLGTASTPNLIKTFNCVGFTINGFVINNNTATNPIYLFQVNGSGKDIVFKNAKITNQPTMKLLEVGSSCTKANTNITMSGFENYDVLFSGDAKIRLPDFENIAFKQDTNSSGRITVAYATYNIPTYLEVFPTTGLGIVSGSVQPYFLSNYLFSTAFTCDVYSGVDGTNVNTANIPIVVNLTCKRI
jgi:hypothetical protein